ncbi:Flavin-containing monooxygenase FMO GS-OX4 [Lachnellula suecica]|uniref:Flavin-containing monooxygenase FMO GS-OX4 n=1 Tax=Lachnellula suecica TaxID=602035 RepID=A0A8T9C6N0_9HELO|nr:Flavin-containing monooxygenase FMO GS-OX4 [Lachnellula suecica]
MEYSDFPYPKNTPLFPKNTVVANYLRSYARELEERGSIRYDTKVNMVKLRRHKGNDNMWEVVCEHTGSKAVTLEYYHSVVVASGFFTKPRVPPVFQFKPHSAIDIIHSMHYRLEEQFRGKKVLIVGKGPSYWDMSIAISKVSDGPVLVSVRDPDNKFVPSQGPASQRVVSEVAKLSAANRKVEFVSNPEEEVDIILLCTGYTYDFTMIPCVQTSNDDKRVLSLYEHMIFIDEKSDPTVPEDLRKIPIKSVLGPQKFPGRSTLAFVGLPTMDSAFLVAEAQSAFIARFLSGRLYKTVPELKEARDAQAREFNKAVATGKRTLEEFHVLNYPNDAEYVDKLFAECLKAENPAHMGIGKLPIFHSPELHWVRTPNFPDGGIGSIRDRFNELNIRGGSSFPTVESLGFNFDDSAKGVKRDGQTIMAALQTLMEEKRSKWTEDYKAWEKASDEWHTRWVEKAIEFRDWQLAKDFSSVSI